MTRLSENTLLNIKNKSFSVTAEVVAPANNGKLSGTILAQGGAIGGWSFYTKAGRAKFTYNLLGIQTFTTEATAELPPGEHQVRAEFAYDGGGIGKGGDVSLYYDGSKVGEGRVELTQALVFSADETADVGLETGTPVVPGEYDIEGSRFNGEIKWVELKIGDDDQTHRVDEATLMHALLGRQ